MSTGVAPDGRVEPSLSVAQQATCGDTAVTDLLRRAGEGSQSAWDEIVRRYERLVWSVARAHRLDSTDAADVVQTTWLRLVEHLGTLHDPERVGAWLATTARRESLRVIGRRKRDQTDGADDLLAALPDSGAGVEESLLGSERDAVVLRAVRRLDERCQRLLRVLAASPPPRYEAVAEAFGMAIGSIGPTRGRCLQRLKDALAELGWS